MLRPCRKEKNRDNTKLWILTSALIHLPLLSLSLFITCPTKSQWISIATPYLLLFPGKPMATSAEFLLNFNSSLSSKWVSCRSPIFTFNLIRCLIILSLLSRVAMSLMFQDTICIGVKVFWWWSTMFDINTSMYKSKCYNAMKIIAMPLFLSISKYFSLAIYYSWSIF